MKKLHLIPFQSVGSICFNDTKEDIINKLGGLKGISRDGKCLYSEYYLIKMNDRGTIYSLCPDDPENCEILYEGLNLNALDYKQIIKELFRKKHEIYGDFSSSPMYIDKNIGVGFVTHESDIGEDFELEALEIASQEAMPDFNDKTLCPDDILITREDQII